MQTITVEELKALKDDGQNFTLIDVREEHEYEAANIDGIHIPLGDVLEHLDQIPREGNVIMQCRSGGRSGRAIKLLEQREGYTNLKNLEGGILAWKDRIDPSLDVS